MKNNRYTFWKLLDENIIEIPIIQRDYAQGRTDEKRIRDKFLDALCEVIKDETKSINLDFVYGEIKKEGKNKKLTPLDGQQRLTTLFLLHWYLATKEDKLSEASEKLQKFTYETRVSSREFCKALTTNQINLSDIDNFIDEKDKKLSKLIEDKNWFFKSWKKDPTIKSMLNMLDAIHERFKNSDDLFKKLICENNPPITFDFLPLNEFKLTDELYVKMNARGKPLTEFENFKSNLVELFEPQTASKLDNEWTDLFWSFKGDKPNKDEYYYIDDKFLNFFSNFIINLGLTSDKLNEKKDLKDIYIMDIYKNILDGEENSKNLKDLISTLDILNDLTKENITIPYFAIFIEKNDISYWDRAKFYSLTMYIIRNQNNIDFKSDKYKNWERVTRNIIDNFNIDSLKKFQDTLKLINMMSEKINNLYEFVASKEFLPDGKYGLRSLEFQQKEEQLKAKIIVNNPDWEKVICDSELETRNSYLDGHIGFLIEMSGNDIEKFKQYFERFKEIFVKDEENFLFQRALLAKGDYLVGENSEYKNRTFCSFNADSPRAKDDNWKQVFHNKRDLLEELLKDNRNLKEIINEFNNTNDWRYGFIKYPEILKYCKQYQIRMKSEKEILLLSKERVYGEHAEYYTYWLKFELEKELEKELKYNFSSSTEDYKYLEIEDKKVIFKDGKWYLNEVRDEHEISRPKIENKEIKYEFIKNK
ncbi:DUF262 domain-containing protein [Aliarcobacter butzleri]|uniref:DUF262 domain-containing protein n=1 Tax=Aliarcobacter butzleri TaxID=28197 RepID=UPI0024DE4D2B|nr:DUF262 domain-containing protein [Aliarcobacter butzleri]MDK2083316.1 DUF262 domain-containing protein [Aliarcobacter butzleri]